MLKNQELIFRMSLHQRIRLITSSKPDENCSVESYEFPVFRFYANPSLKSTDAFATFFPSDKALASAFDGQIIKSVYECTGNEAKANKEFSYFNVTNCLKKEGISDDNFITSSFLKNKSEGVKASGAFLNFDDNPATDNIVIANETAEYIKTSVVKNVNSIRFNSVEKMEEFKKKNPFKGCFFGVASNKEDVAKYVSLGATLVFVKGETAEGLEDYLVALTDKYIKAKEELDEGEIELAEFDRRIRNGEILDAEAVNASCDSMISLLLALKNNGAQSVEEPRIRIGKSAREPLFNEPYHDKLAYHSAQQSIVLIKNQNKILPLKKEIPVAVIGEYAANNDYRITNENKPTALHRPFDEINAYKNINAVGYAHGYCAGESRRLDLIETALNLCDEAKVALVYLCAGKGETAIPAGQRELLDALFRKGVKVIAVVSAEKAVDLSFADRCEAVLFHYNAGQGCAQAVFDILTGEISPSGKLIDTFYKDGSAVTEEEGIPSYCTASVSNVLYPFGYGLSFTEFEYKNLKITEKGASCTVTNKGRYDGYATLLMFVHRPGAHTAFANRILRGFKKVFVRKGEAVKLEIPFDDDTFKVYDRENDRQFVQGGKYEISLCENVNAIMLRAEFDVKERTFAEKIVNTPVKNTGAAVTFTDTELDRAIKREKKKLSFGLRLFIVLALTVYYDAMCAGLIFSNLIAEKTAVLYIVLGVLLAIGNILALVYVVILCKKRKLQNYMHPNEVLTDMVARVKEFDEIAKVVYNKPVEKPIVEFNPPDDEDGEEGEEPVRRYDATFAEDEEEVEFSQKVSFNELCNSFRAYASNRGVNVELSSVRSLISATVSGKLLFISCKNKDVLPAFSDIVSEYFSVAGRVKASDEWNTPEDLLWKKGDTDGDFVLSDISNALNSASKTPERNCCIMIENVNMQNIGDYFSAFTDYANFPSEDHTLRFNDDVSLKLPQNLCFMLFPSSDSFTEELTPQLAHAGILVEIIAGKCAVKEGASDEIKVISRMDLEEIVGEAKEQFFVSENVWKKLDAFTDAVSATERFTIDNKSLLQLEKYTSVLLECGSDENEALVNMFTAKIILLLKVSKAYRKEKGGAVIYGIIEKLFGDENLSAIQRALVSNV